MTPAELEVRRILADVYTPQGIETWLDRWAYQGRTARELLADGRGEVVRARAQWLAGWTS